MVEQALILKHIVNFGDSFIQYLSKMVHKTGHLEKMSELNLYLQCLHQEYNPFNVYYVFRVGLFVNDNLRHEHLGVFIGE
jgi:hypothetical protein